MLSSKYSVYSTNTCFLLGFSNICYLVLYNKNTNNGCLTLFASSTAFENISLLYTNLIHPLDKSIP